MALALCTLAVAVAGARPSALQPSQAEVAAPSLYTQFAEAHMALEGVDVPADASQETKGEQHDYDMRAKRAEREEGPIRAMPMASDIESAMLPERDEAHDEHMLESESEGQEDEDEARLADEPSASAVHGHRFSTKAASCSDDCPGEDFVVEELKKVRASPSLSWRLARMCILYVMHARARACPIACCLAVRDGALPLASERARSVCTSLPTSLNVLFGCARAGQAHSQVLRRPAARDHALRAQHIFCQQRLVLVHER